MQVTSNCSNLYNFIKQLSWVELSFELICRDNKEIVWIQEYHCVNWTCHSVNVGSLWRTSVVQFKETGFILLISPTKFNHKDTDVHKFSFYKSQTFFLVKFSQCELRQKFLARSAQTFWSLFGLDRLRVETNRQAKSADLNLKHCF